MNNLTYPPKLSPTQCKVLYYLCQGKMYKEIADIMTLSINTVKNHAKIIYKKLEVSNRTEACNVLHQINFKNGVLAI